MGARVYEAFTLMESRNMIRKAAKAVVCAVLSGWVIPLWLAGWSFISWESEMQRNTGASFPFLEFSKDMLAYGSVWLLASRVVVAWRQLK